MRLFIIFALMALLVSFLIFTELENNCPEDNTEYECPMPEDMDSGVLPQ